MCKFLNVAVNKCINWCFVHLLLSKAGTLFWYLLSVSVNKKLMFYHECSTGSLTVGYIDVHCLLL